MAEDAKERVSAGSDGVSLAVEANVEAVHGTGGDVVSSPESTTSTDDGKTTLVGIPNVASFRRSSRQRYPLEADQKVQMSAADTLVREEVNSTTSSLRSSRERQPNEDDQKVQTSEADGTSEETCTDAATLSNEIEGVIDHTMNKAASGQLHAIPAANEENPAKDTANWEASAPVVLNVVLNDDGVAAEVGPTVIDDIMFGVQAPFQERLVLDILWYSWLASFAPQTIGRVCKLVLSQSDIASIHKLLQGAISLGSRIVSSSFFAAKAIVCCVIFLLIGTYLTSVYLRNPSDFGRKVKLFIERSNSSAINNSTGFNIASDKDTPFNDTALLYDTEFNDTAFNSSSSNNTATLGGADDEISSWTFWTRIILSRPMTTCVFTPIIEEVTFRVVLPALMQRCFNILRRQRQNQSGSINKSIVSICSFLFAVAHLTGFDLTKEKHQSSAMYRFIYTMLGAEWILAPAYEERGFAAAWAAHGSFNALVSFGGWFKKYANK